MAVHVRGRVAAAGKVALDMNMSVILAFCSTTVALALSLSPSLPLSRALAPTRLCLHLSPDYSVSCLLFLCVSTVLHSLLLTQLSVCRTCLAGYVKSGTALLAG